MAETEKIETVKAPRPINERVNLRAVAEFAARADEPQANNFRRSYPTTSASMRAK